MNDTGTLTVLNLSLKYPNGTLALENISFELTQGTILALLGPSGSGKSTLLRAIAGLEPYQKGNVLWNGKDLKKVPPHKRGFGFMFQDGQLFTHTDVAGNIEYSLKVQKVPTKKRKELVKHLLNRVGLAGYEKRSVTTLSGGQAQRVALARSLAASPKLLMLDEPLSSLDKDLRISLAKDLSRILRESKTSAILVTHDENEAAMIADKTIRLRDGKIVSPQA